MPGADCDFPVNHYFRNSTQYTVLLIIENDVSKNISAYGVNIYEGKKIILPSVISILFEKSIVSISVSTAAQSDNFPEMNELVLK